MASSDRLPTARPERADGPGRDPGQNVDAVPGHQRERIRAGANGDAAEDAEGGGEGSSSGSTSSSTPSEASTSSEVSTPSPPAAPVGPDPSLVHRIAPLFKLLRLYSRLEVEGVEHIPDGPAILVANHTGWTGLDYAYAALTVHDTRKRMVRGLAHKTWFQRHKVADLARRLGLIEVSKNAMEALVDEGELVLIFPEGEQGAFKGEAERYMLRPFARGYVRVAMKTGVPIVPVAIVGGEEANPSSRLIDSYEDILDLALPMPVNFFPRPVKWRISFLPPIALEGGAEAATDREKVHAVNDRIRHDIQDELHRLVSVRGNPFF